MKQVVFFLLLFLFPGIVSAQYVKHLDYWKSRKIVTFLVECDDTGEILKSELLENHAGNVNTDSLANTLIGQSLPPEQRSYRGNVLTVGISFDRNLEYLPDREKYRIPDELVNAVSKSEANIWFDNLKTINIDFKMNFFALSSHNVSIRNRIPRKGDLSFLSDSKKFKFGLIKESPDGRYMLDPESCMELDGNNRPGWDTPMCYTIYDLSNSEEIISVTTNHISMISAGWITNSKCYIIACTRIITNNDKIHDIWAPCLIYIDTDTRKIERYLGPPISIFDEEKRREIILKTRNILYPDINWFK